MDIKQVVLTMAERFASDNLITTQRAQITREEWGTVALDLQRLERFGVRMLIVHERRTPEEAAELIKVVDCPPAG